MIKILKENDIYKINFAGGEPFMNQYLGDYIQYAKEIGLKTSIITNASRMTY
jgi:MoaA/NifB/PqqE/SkfB family radical SAM enzyme